jgi:hypothetical protein
MNSENISKYLKKYVSNINKQKAINLDINAGTVSKSGDHELHINLNDGFEAYKIHMFIPFDNREPAIIRTESSESTKKIDTNMGNSRNVRLEHDMETVSNIIIEGAKKESAIRYIEGKLLEIFNKEKFEEDEQVNSKTSKRVTIKLAPLEELVQLANIKGAGILAWYKTPNSKIVLKFKHKDSENYGSEEETGVHLYNAYMLKNKHRSSRIF